MLRLPRSVLWGLVFLTAFRLLVAAHLPLGDDETFYWEWSRHLAAGYVDHPPAIAFLVSAATHLFGSTPFAVHSLGVLLSFVTAIGVWALGREVLGRDAGATWSIILLNVIPVFSAGALLAAPDAPLGVGWVFALLWAWRAARAPADEPGHLGRWLAAGAWTGLGLLSKYTAAALPLGIGVWLALSSEHRRWLRRREPYWGLALAAALFLPVILWNATHQWASFTFTFLGRPNWSDGGNFPTFVLFQFVYLAPLMFPVLLWALWVASRRGLAASSRDVSPSRWRFLAATSVPLVAVMFAASLFGHIKGHWPAPAYITGAIAVAGIATERPWAARSALWRTSAAGILASTVLLTALIYALPALAPALLPPRLDPTVDYYGWPQAAHQIADVARRDARGPFFVTSDRYQILAQFDYATGGRYAARTITGQDQYDLWTRWADLRGQDALFIRDGRYPPKVDLARGCRAVEPEPAIPITRHGVVVRTLGLVWCREFLGRPIAPVTARR